jgi:hypothetical protein
MILAITKRWHWWTHRAAGWMLRHVLLPLVKRLEDVARSSGNLANQQHDKARLRMEICKRCPAFDATLRRCRDCGCFMPAKTQLPAARCPQGRW